MRVIAGTARGTVLRTIEGEATRPTVDRVKEALFSSIQFEIRDARCLDAFAGSGALGIEALSRGASHVVFIDESPACQKVINLNLDKTRMQSRATVYCDHYRSILSQYKGEAFDLVFLDPPYGQGFCHEIMTILVSKGLIKPTTIVVIEHNASEPLQPTYGDLQLVKTKKYGISHLSRYVGK